MRTLRRPSRASDFAYLDAPTPHALAHRGGLSYGPNIGLENSMAAFRTAVEMGYRYLETDVHATLDGELVAFHDPRLDRVTDMTGAIADLPYADVRRARIGDREPIPLLADLFEEFPDTRINIDIKDDRALAATLREIRRHAAEERVCVGAFSPRRLHAARAQLGPTVCTAAGQIGTAVMRFTPALLSRLLHTPAPVLQVPARHPLGGRWVELVTPGFLRRAHALGKQVHVWFHAEQPQDADEMHRLLDLGCDGLVVDHIDILKEVLAQRGHSL